MVNRHGITGIAACLAVVIASCETPKPTASKPAAKIAHAAQSAWDAPPLSIPGNLHITSITADATDASITLAWTQSLPAEFVSNYSIRVWGGGPNNRVDGEYITEETHYTILYFRRPPAGAKAWQYRIAVRGITVHPKDRTNSAPSDTLVVSITGGD